MTTSDPHGTSVWKIRLAILFFGVACGTGYQFYKVERGADAFWNFRLLVLCLAGVLFFYAFAYLNRRLLKLLTGKSGIRVQAEDMKTYLPFGLLFFFPVQKALLYMMWPSPAFPYFLYLLAIYVAMFLILKTYVVVSLRREGFSESGGAEPTGSSLVGNAWLSLAAVALGISFFGLHQIALAFDDFYRHFFFSESDAGYVLHDSVSRKTFARKNKIEHAVGVRYENARAVIAYKLFDKPGASWDGRLPLIVEVTVRDGSGKVFEKRRRVLDAADDGHLGWEEIEIDLSPVEEGEVVRFFMKGEPALWEIGWSQAAKFFLHSPVDFGHFRELNTHIVWSEPRIISVNSKRPNVILISADALRADALGCYGAARDVSPAIDSFARESLMFRNAFSQSTWTLSSHLSMLTSRFPNEFGRDGFFRGDGSGKSIPYATLAEILEGEGYYCAAFTDGGFVSSHYGFPKGFVFYYERYGPDSNSLRMARDWVGSNAEKNFFLFLHTYVVHDYWMGEKLTAIGSGGTGGETAELFRAARSVFPELEDPKHFLAVPKNSDFYSLLRNKRKEWRDWYDVRIRLFDGFFRELLAALKQHGIYDDSLIIFTSDHGESFAEPHNNGKMVADVHCNPPYDSEIRVPLIVKLPASAGQEPVGVDSVVSLLDIVPTVLSMLDLESDPPLRGRPLLAFAEEAQRGQRSPVYAVNRIKGGCILVDGKKYIYHGDGQEEELYDLASDPRETRNLAPLEEEELLELRRRYFEFTSEMGEWDITADESMEAAPPELRENLKALGYIQ